MSDIMPAGWGARARQTVISGARLPIATHKSCTRIDHLVPDQGLHGQIPRASGELADTAAVKPPPRLANNNQIAAAHQMAVAQRAMASDTRLAVNSVRV